MNILHIIHACIDHIRLLHKNIRSMDHAPYTRSLYPSLYTFLCTLICISRTLHFTLIRNTPFEYMPNMHLHVFLQYATRLSYTHV